MQTLADPNIIGNASKETKSESLPILTDPNVIGHVKNHITDLYPCKTNSEHFIANPTAANIKYPQGELPKELNCLANMDGGPSIYVTS